MIDILLHLHLQMLHLFKFWTGVEQTAVGQIENKCVSIKVPYLPSSLRTQCYF